MSERNGALRGSPPSATADQVGMRRSNLAAVLRHLRHRGPRSRARISQEIGLNKATVSSLVAELIERRLVREGEMARGAVGRPAQGVEVDGQVGGLGVEVNVDYVGVVVLDLRGEQVHSARVPVDVPQVGVAGTLDVMAAQVRAAVTEVAAKGVRVVGVTVAIPGLVESVSGLLHRAPNLGWADIGVADELAVRLDQPGLSVRVENDANLGALAEYVLGAAAGTADLVYVTGEVGVGAGVISAGSLVLGAEGFSGEIGHLPIGSGHPCRCGRSSCWETEVGFAALLRRVAGPGDRVADPAVDLDQRLEELHDRARVGDPTTLAGLREVGHHLGVGASVVVNLVNPQVIVLGGYFAVLGEYLRGPAEAAMRTHVFGDRGVGCRIVFSTLGFSASALGGAHVALQVVLDDPTSAARAPAAELSVLSPTGGPS